MRILIASTLAIVLGSTSALAFHKPGHDKAFPGEPSGKFTLRVIEAGATCTDLIEEPEGVNLAVHGGPKKFGFIGEEELAVVVVSEDPDVVMVCFVDETPREDDVSVRVSFEAEEEEEEV